MRLFFASASKLGGRADRDNRRIARLLQFGRIYTAAYRIHVSQIAGAEYVAESVLRDATGPAAEVEVQGEAMPIHRRSFASVVLVVLIAGLAAGCASSGQPSAGSDQNDPYESFNRKVFAFNQKVDEAVALPVARAYRYVVPEPARKGIHNALANLNEPVTLANDLLQGQPVWAAQTLGRIVVNSTFGLGGLVDLASPMGIPPDTEDFGETLAAYGAGEGPYLVLPLLGPSNPRDLAGDIVDIGFDPLTYIGMREKTLWMAGKQVLGIVDKRAENIETIEEVERSSVDLYATLRSLYRQHREAEIRHGKPDLQNLPNI